MRKIIFSVAVLIAANLNLLAQDEKSYGPVAGNYAIGISSGPMWEYLGNFFGKTERNTAPTADIANGHGIFGKYYTSDNSAIRAGINFNALTSSEKHQDIFWDKTTTNSFHTSISLGLERRLGEGRFQAFYGPSAGIGFSSSSTTYDYDANPEMGNPLKAKYGTEFNIAAGAFAGAEFFLASKIAIGTELGFGLNYSHRGDGTLERHNMEDEPFAPGRSSLSLGFRNTPAQMAPRGSLYITFYF